MGIILCQQIFLLQFFSLLAGSSFPFWKVFDFWFFFYDFKNTEHLITLVNSNSASREPQIIFIALMVSPSANWRAWPWQYIKWTQFKWTQLVYARCYSSLRTNHVGCPIKPFSRLLCLQQSDATLLCENYAKLYFDAKHLEKGLNRRWWKFWPILPAAQILYIITCPS